MRIIAGEYGGRVLETLPGRATRPLLGQVREALFNILGERVEGAHVWDLFAGSGASGLEALSRGAERVVFVEKANRALAVLRANLDLLGDSARERSHVVRADAWAPPPMTLRGEETEPPPGIVFFDPPYPDVREDPVRAAAAAFRLVDRLAPGGVLLFHFPEGVYAEEDFDGPAEVDLRAWGSSAVALLGRRA